MSFQTDDLSMLILGVQGDQPPDAEQPALPNGIHCRWLFAPERGFPWHGFYLFRRESQPRQPLCLSPALRRLRPGTSQGLVLETPLGRLGSARPFVFTEEFPPSGVVEVDLNQAMLRFDLPAGVEARRVDLQIGLRSAGPSVTRTCVDFRTFPMGTGPSPRTEQGAVFATERPPVSPSVALTSIEQWQGSPPGLQATRHLQIALPCPATRVDLLLTNQADIKIEALAADGRSVGGAAAVALKAGTITLTGQAIAKVVLTGPAFDSGLLHQICWECPGAGPGKGAVIEVAALAGTAVAARTVVQGNAGQVVAATLEGKGITAVQLGGGNAVLVDLCVWPSQQGVTFGWGEVPGFTYPLCLPVAHQDYPCPGKPADFNAAKALALSRVTYGQPNPWAADFPKLHGQLELLVQGGPGGGPMAGRVNPELRGDPLGPAPGLEPLKLPKQSALDLVLLASLHPAIAQMLGLYFLDASAEPGIPYDYLLLADPAGVLGGSAAMALQWLALAADPNAVDAYLASGKTAAPAPPLPAPGLARAYALPGATTRTQDGKLNDAQTNVGLWWAPPPAPAAGVLEEPVLPVLYYPRRAFLGTLQPAAPPPASAYHPLRPDATAVVLAEPVDPPPPLAPGETRGSPEWPPASIPLHVIDSALVEGWYSYRISSQDLFGRHSPLGPPAEWYQWDPTPGTPPPWYYQQNAPGHHSIHSFAVALLDKIPPPRPTGVEATALDPLDRWVLQDEAYTTWRDAHKGAVGLRVCWQWTLAHMNQAPDTHEFRIYYVPGRSSELPSGMGLDDLRRPTAWTQRLRVVGYNENVKEGFKASRDPEGKPLAGPTSGATASGNIVHLAGDPDLSGVQPFLDHLSLDQDTARPDKTYKILGVDPKLETVTVEGIPNLMGDSPWTLGRPVRRYEIFLTPPDFAPGSEFEPSLDHPTVFAQIGISAADDKTHTGDDPKWTGPTGGRFGNEGIVGGPAAIFRVLQTPPDPPDLGNYPDQLLATPADYHSDSFFTFRWMMPKAGLTIHVFRALDDSLFQVDREHRPRPALDPSQPADALFFPTNWSKARCDGVAAELNKLNQTGADYGVLSNDALRILAGLHGNEDAFTQITLQPLDPADPATFDRRGPDDPPGRTADPGFRAYLDTLPGRATNRYFYRAAAVDGAHNRSGLSLSTPPVHLPKVEPPRAPVITKVIGGDREITIWWARNREADLAEYRAYRTASLVSAEDLRLMALVEALPVAKSGTVSPVLMWTDKTAPAFRNLYYRLVAVDASGNPSPPSPILIARAFDDTRPAPPVWNPPLAGSMPGSILLSWGSEAGLRSMVQRRKGSDFSWGNLSAWLVAGQSSFEDQERQVGDQHIYRLLVMDGQGRLNKDFHELAI
jgi:hypothetical protein